MEWPDNLFSLPNDTTLIVEAKMIHLAEERSARDHALQSAPLGKIEQRLGLKILNQTIR